MKTKRHILRNDGHGWSVLTDCFGELGWACIPFGNDMSYREVVAVLSKIPENKGYEFRNVSPR